MSSEQQAPLKDAQTVPPWVYKALSKSQVFLNRLSAGRFFNRFNGGEVCFVTMIGAKSGKSIVMPLIYIPYEEGILLVASKGGAPRHPHWYHNLVKHPQIEVRHRGTNMDLRAELATKEEKETLWPICDTHYADFADYRAATERDIPIFICQPL